MGLIEQLEDDFDLELCFEIAEFVVVRGDPSLFMQSAGLLVKAIEDVEDYRMLLSLIAEFHRCLDSDVKEKAVKQALTTLKADAKISDEDRAFALAMLKHP
jgi:hypothetical protein